MTLQPYVRLNTRLMRTTEAQIKLIWKNGIIYLSVTWKTRILRSTGFKVEKKYWNAQAEKVRKPAPNYQAINAAITKLKNTVVERKNAYILQGIEYNSKMLLEEKAPVNVLTLEAIKNEMAEERNYKYGTIESFRTALNCWADYTPRDSIKNIDLNTVRGFLPFLRERGCKAGTIKLLFMRLGSIFRYAIEKGYTTENPFEKFNIHRRVKVRERHPALTKYQMDLVLEYMGWQFMVTGDAWKRIVKRAGRNVSPESCLALFCFSYLAGGAAPIDCLLLKCDDIIHKVINGRAYYVAHIHRSKTEHPVSVLIKITPSTAALINALKERGGKRLFSILENVDDNDDETIMKKKRYLLGQGQAVLRGVFAKINEVIADRNKRLDIEEPLIDIKEVSFYSARHTLATTLANSNVSLNAISSVMGRSVEGIGRYIKSLTNDSDIAAALENIY